MHLRLQDLGRAGEREQHVALRCRRPASLWVRNWSTRGEHAQDLLGRRLPDLADGADLRAVLVVDGVLVVDLDELGLLVHDQHRLGEDRAAARRRRCRRRPWPTSRDDLLGRPVRRSARGAAADRRVDRLLAVRRDVLGPLGAVPVAQLVAAERIGVPVRRVSASRHGREATDHRRRRTGAAGRRASGEVGAGVRAAALLAGQGRRAERPADGGQVAQLPRRRVVARRPAPAQARGRRARATRPSAARRRRVVIVRCSSSRLGTTASRPAGGDVERSAADVAAAEHATAWRRWRAGPSTPRSMASTTRGPNTMPSSSEFDASRLAPVHAVAAASPATQSPGSDEAPSRSATMPPQL